ncbi:MULTISPECIES: ClpXP protease specificity-enhancing factor [Rheinheimera]|uniref:ClpXP protease specificity-enhancing factor n=1 Tax=Rheinheimera marina TaxID=1774958 RepID=A0ABV9JM51_9GAMM
MDMTSNKPYLVRAFYDWIVDNNLTPYLVVNATVRGVKVPQQHVQNGQIVLNINPSAIGNLQMGNDFISFNARFGGQPFALSVPVKAVLAIYARENGAGTMFEAELDEEEIDVDLELDDDLPEPSEPTPPAAKKVSHLKVIK